MRGGALEVEMEERADPTFIKFGVGETIEGVLCSIDKLMIGEPKKPAVRYVCIEPKSRIMFCFLGTVGLNNKIRLDDRGKLIKVTLRGHDAMVSRNGNEMKVFDVFVSRARYPMADFDPTLITDDDIPF